MFWFRRTFTIFTNSTNAAMLKLYHITRLEDVENRIKAEEVILFGKKEEIIQKLEEERRKIIEEEKLFDLDKEKQLEKGKIEEMDDEFKDISDGYLKIFASVEILLTSFSIYETVLRNPDWNCENKTKIISLDIQHIAVDYRMKKVGRFFSICFENIIVYQEIIVNPNYSNIFFGDLTCPRKILNIEFEINPKLKKSDIRFTERKV